MRTRVRRVAEALLAAGVMAAPAAAQTPSPTPASPAPATAVVVAGREYRAGGLHRLFFGSHYRTTWTTPLRVEVIDLATFSGGLVPEKKGGGKQTKSLKLAGRDGRQWKFRSVNKDPSAVLPPELRDTFVDAIVQDQISAAEPAAPLVVDALIEAAGILHVPHRLIVLPDDPLLGEFRKDFGGVLGFLEEDIRLKPPATPGFEAFDRVLDTEELWKHLDDNPDEKVDARALLLARLFDVLINDFDRHKDQWQWGRRRGAKLWEPIPEDRDQAFARYNGLLLSLVRPSQPRLVDFNETYPGIFGLTWQGRFLDRRHLAELAWPAWQEAVTELQARVTDEVIDRAVHRLPAEYYRIDGATLTAKLRSRRRLLLPAARTFYRILAKDVEVYGTDHAETAEVHGVQGGGLEVTLTTKADQTYFQRRFDPGETGEIRIFLQGGDDRLVHGAGEHDIRLRVVGGHGDDVLDDTPGGHSHLYDSAGHNQIVQGPGTSFSDTPYKHPLDSSDDPARDWGRMHAFLPRFSAGGDLGVLFGGSMQFTGYGFRKHPFASQQTIGLAYSTGLSAFRADYDGQFARTNSRRMLRLVARASQADLARFYGFGNQTRGVGPDRLFQVVQRHVSVAPSFRVGIKRADLWLGGVAQFTQTPTPFNRFIGLLQPYGAGDFGELGARAQLVLDGRDRARAASKGAFLRATGTFFPQAWNVKDPFGEVHGEAAAYLTPPVAHGPTLALRAGGKRVWGRYPFHEAAFVGGPDTVRGLHAQRYAGDAAVFGNAELRVRLGRVSLLVPSDIGVFGLADAGRVFLGGESSDRWHTGVGGGLWLAVLNPGNTFSVSAARSEGGTRFYVQGGFGF